MSTQRSAKTRKDHPKQRLPNGNVFEFMVKPAEAEAEICLIRVTMPPGAAIPLHSHPDVGLFMFLKARLKLSSPETGFPDGRPSAQAMLWAYRETSNTHCVIVHRTPPRCVV